MGAKDVKIVPPFVKLVEESRGLLQKLKELLSESKRAKDKERREVVDDLSDKFPAIQSQIRSLCRRIKDWKKDPYLTESFLKCAAAAQAMRADLESIEQALRRSGLVASENLDRVRVIYSGLYEELEILQATVEDSHPSLV